MGSICNGKYYVEDEESGVTLPVLVMAKNTATGETVAVKKMPEGRSESSNELKIWKDFYPDDFRGSYCENNWLYIERKWYDGVTLSELGRMTENNALEIIMKLIDCVDDFHKRSGLVHGDLKPENVVTCDNEVHLIDFETAAKERLPNRVKIGKIQTIKFITPGFSAPEILRGELSVKSDIYSLGKILLYLITGGVVEGEFDGDTAVADIIQKCTQYRPEKRFRNIAELRNSVKEVLESSVEEKISRIVAKPVASEGVLYTFNKIGYRRLVIYAPGNLEFATEFATHMADTFKLSVGVCEFYNVQRGNIGFYVREKRATEENLIAAENSKAEYDNDYNLLKIAEKWDNLKFDSKRLDDSGIGDNDNMRDFIVNAYTENDLTIISDGMLANDEQRAQLMRFCDYTVFTLSPDVERFEGELLSWKKFMEDHAVPIARMLVVSWEYTEGESADEKCFLEICGDKYLGYVQADKKRHRTKNIKGGYYSEKMSDFVSIDYDCIAVTLFGKTGMMKGLEL